MGQVSGKSIFEKKLEPVIDQETIITPRYIFSRNWSNISTLTKQQICI